MLVEPTSKTSKASSPSFSIHESASLRPECMHQDALRKATREPIATLRRPIQLPRPLPTTPRPPTSMGQLQTELVPGLWETFRQQLEFSDREE
jgi:hypothetical protein